jgi:hypothetical protein
MYRNNYLLNYRKYIEAKKIHASLQQAETDYMLRRDSMSQHNKEEKAQDSLEELKHANERRIEELLRINNRYVRTQRHLEENSDIASLDQIKHSFEIQGEREARMENLKNIIAYGKHENVDEVQNLKRNLEFTDHYLQHHDAHMDDSTLQNTKEKQEHRKDQLKFLD